METDRGTAASGSSRPPAPQVRWGGVLAGSAVSGATYLMLALIGFAAGFTVIGQDAARSARVAVLPGVWTTFALFVAALTGGYAAARLAGLARRADGVLHGWVTWAIVTLLLGWLATTAARPVLAGSLGMLGGWYRPVAVESVPPGYAAAVAGASWWLVGMLLLSLVGAIWGGALGARSVSRRAVEDHAPERHLHSD